MPRDLYSTEELLPMVTSLTVPGNFLLKIGFPEIIEFETEQVFFDRILDDKRMAPFVSPYAPGKIQQPKGFQTDSLIPAYLKPKNSVRGTDVMKRRPGEPLGGAYSPAERRDLLMLDYLMTHRTKIDRRMEWMASSVLRTGAVTIVGDDYPSVTVNFGRTGSLTKTLTSTARWGESGVSPYSNVQSWIDEVGSQANAAVNIVVTDKLAWALYIADPLALKALDKTLGQTTTAYNLGLTPNLPGSPTFKGRDGNIEFYVYNDVYEDDAGNSAQLVPDYTVMLVAQGGLDGAQLFGAILDPKNQFGAAAYFSKQWEEDDPAAEFVMTQSAPILGPRRINATLCATVR